VLDAIVRVAGQPIKYSIQDYAVVFSAKTREATPLYIRTFKVDPNRFYQGLQGEGALSYWKSFELPANNTGGSGFKFITSTNKASDISMAARNYFERLGANLDPVANPGKSVFYNDRQGMLLVRATLQDLDLIEAAIQIFNIVPPQVNIKVKFVEVPQDDTKALGFDWYLGNVLMTNGAVGGPAGTTTSNAISPTASNPMGVFPGNPLVASPTNIAPSSTNQILTSGLRNTYTSPSTLTGILTDPQFRVVIKALQQRSGTELLAQPEITISSGRQGQMKAVDIQNVVKGINQQAFTPPGISTTNVDESGLYVTERMEFGPMLDVIPSVLPDGFTIALNVIPTVTEFLGYREDQTNHVAVYVNGKKKWVIPPEPIVRIRRMSASVRVWDGQTVVLGGLPSETVSLLKDKVPVLGDLPLVGPLFRSEPKATTKKNLLVFITPTLIDPAGNRMHTEEDMPSTRGAVPPQAP
jgi:general secretion pathway protein D